MHQGIITISIPTRADFLVLEAAAQSWMARQHRLDPRLPQEAFVPQWMVFPNHNTAACWIALQDGAVAGGLSGYVELWAEEEAFASVFPREYTHLFLLGLPANNGPEALAALLRRVDDWPPGKSVTGRLLLAPACDRAVLTALRGLGFRPFHAVAARPLKPSPQSLPLDGLRVRPADADDVDVVGQLMAESWRFHAQYQPAIEISPEVDNACREKAHEMLGDGQASELLVAESAGEVVGFFGIALDQQQPRTRLSFLASGTYGDIFEVAVRADLRRQGVGAALFAAAWHWFAARNVPALFVNYAPTNPASSHFWPRLGFTDLWINWWRP